MVTATTTFLPREELDRLFAALGADGRRIIGPTVVDGAVVHDELTAPSQLPIGHRSSTAPGIYRLEASAGNRAFDYGVALTAWKRFTLPPVVPLTVARREGDRAETAAVTEPAPRLAFLGVRACELAALRIQERVLRAGPLGDADHAARRDAALVVAVECAAATETCFCTSMGTGPEVGDGADLVLSELDEGFTIRSGSPAGDAIVEQLALGPATPEQLERATAQVAAVRDAIGDPVATEGLPDRLRAALDNPRWADVAERCLACANCTLVCPTCFCTSVTVASDLDGLAATTERRWDSCFSQGFARVAGDANFRPKVKDRYRQWLTHKFATWWDQFGSSGCVGCGRCVAWCPVGIDVRAELAAIAPAIPANGAARVAGPNATGVNAAGAIAADAASAAIAAGAAVAAPVPAGVATPGPIPWPPAPAAGRAPAPLAAVVRAPHAPATIRAIERETLDTATLRLETPDEALLAARPGQFVMVEWPAFPAPPISISRLRADGLDLTIRSAGAATRALNDLPVGAELTLRGPYGRPWPIETAEGRDVVIVAGGIGLAPLRPVIERVLADRPRYRAVRLFLGARTPRDRLFVDEMAAIAGRVDVELAEIVDRAGPDWLGRVGIVTQLFDQAPWDGSTATAFVCGPERMMQATAAVLQQRGIGPDRIWVTLERNMACGVGTCGHCQLGPFFVCRDGPVFSIAELGSAFTTEGL